MLALTTIFAGQAQRPEQPDPLSSRLRSDLDLRKETCYDAVVILFSTVDTGGGVVMSEPYPGPPRVNAALHSGMTFPEALKKIAQGCAVQLVSTQGSLNVIIGTRVPELLETRIESFQWDLSEGLSATLDRLMANRAVQQRVVQLHLSEQPKYGGPDLITGKPTVLHGSRIVTNVSLRDALNTVTRSYGDAVWAYREDISRGQRSYGVTVGVDVVRR